MAAPATPDWFTAAFPPYPPHRQDYTPTSADDKFFADKYYDVAEGMEQLGMDEAEQKKGWEWWRNAVQAIKKFGADSQQVIAIKYKAAETWGKDHPIVVGIVSLAAAVAVDEARKSG